MWVAARVARALARGNDAQDGDMPFELAVERYVASVEPSIRPPLKPTGDLTHNKAQ